MDYSKFTAGLAFAIVCGCAAEEASPDGSIEDRTFVVIHGWGCHSCDYKNSPHLGTHPMNEFELGGGQLGGLALDKIEDPTGKRHPVEFQVDALVASTPAGLVAGGDLVGWTLIFELSGSELRVPILAHEKHWDWLDTEMIDTYGIAYESIDPATGDPGLLEVCTGLTPAGGEDATDTNVVFIPGETYDHATKTVQPGQGNLVSIGCRGHAVAKLKFLGHDPNDNYGSSPEQRQAALKMLTADYCGNGDPYTTVGQPLEWIDEVGLFYPNWPAWYVPNMEARWDENGAWCLNEPRNPKLRREDVDCELPHCDGPVDQQVGERWTSYHPAP